MSYPLFNPGLPAASGSFNEDFTATFAGAGYRHASWDVSTRVEFHAGDRADKWNWLAGANHQLADGKVLSASFAVLNEKTHAGAVQDTADARVGFAWRPDTSRWTLLNRTDLVFEERRDGVYDTRSRKWVNNFNANFKPDARQQVSLQFGFKYNVENIDDREYRGVTSLYGVEYRYDLTPRWDVGMKGSLLTSHATKTQQKSYGVSVGYSPIRNAWISMGYNFAGYDDDDFIAADYTARGPFVKVRLKFDQDAARRFLEFAGIGRSRQLQSYANSR
jgi:hypothetical protein